MTIRNRNVSNLANSIITCSENQSRTLQGRQNYWLLSFIFRSVTERSSFIHDAAGETRVNKINTRVHFIVSLKMKSRAIPHLGCHYQYSSPVNAPRRNKKKKKKRLQKPLNSTGSGQVTLVCSCFLHPPQKKREKQTLLKPPDTFLFSPPSAPVNFLSLRKKKNYAAFVCVRACA